jgi:DNA polymerase V
MADGEKQRKYIAIDLKSFYASVECVERGLDPLDVNLVVADSSRTEKTICLAVSPALKSHGIGGRARLFEVVQKVKEVNYSRRRKAPHYKFEGKSYSYKELMQNPALELDYIIAKPRMALYMDYSTRIYNIYLKYVAPEDMHVYSVDEVFIDATDYLKINKMSARDFAMMLVKDVLKNTGITATAGVGTNMYLCKIAMDIVAKRMPADSDGVRIAELDELSYRRELWSHTPITDFWRVGKGYANKLEQIGIYTMGDIARASLGKDTDFYNENLFYKLFGINAELLIDHAWGYEPCTIADVQSYMPTSSSLSQGQVLHCPYNYEKSKLIIREMTDLLVLDLVEKRLTTNQIVLEIGYDIENLTDPERRKKYKGEIVADRYGREIPKHAHGTANLKLRCSSTKIIMAAVVELFDKIVDKNLLTRRMSVTACNVLPEGEVDEADKACEQLDMFSDYEQLEKQNKEQEEQLKKEKSVQHTLIKIKNKYGKNAIVKGMNLEEGATTIDRNGQIGGHKA